MKSNIKISKYHLNDLNLNQINKLFELTELQLKWFNTYYPLINPPFYKLLKMNHKKILNYMKIDLMSEYTIEDIDNKINRMFNAYHSLFEISNSRIRKKINNQLNSHG